jgi:hypothetical protein
MPPVLPKMNRDAVRSGVFANNCCGDNARLDYLATLIYRHQSRNCRNLSNRLSLMNLMSLLVRARSTEI